jgi:hypothetical protein
MALDVLGVATLTVHPFACHALLLNPGQARDSETRSIPAYSAVAAPNTQQVLTAPLASTIVEQQHATLTQRISCHTSCQSREGVECGHSMS